MKDNSIIFLKDWKPLIFSLSIEHQSVFWELFTSYEYGTEQNCENDFVKPIWNFIKSQLDNMKEKYNERVVERNRENGSKGGRPKNPTKPKQTQQNLKNPMGKNETQKTPNDKDNVNDNVKEKDNNNVNDFYRIINHLKLSLEDFEKLLYLGYSKKQIDDILDSIENYKLNKNYTSLFLTAKKWLQKETPSAQKSSFDDDDQPRLKSAI